MSFGIEVTNPGINKVILDEKNPVYIAPPVRVTGYNTWVDGSHYNQQFELTLAHPLTGESPPMLFLSGLYRREFANVVGYPDLEDGDWISDLVFVPLGTPKNWTGIRVTMRANRGWSNGGRPNRPITNQSHNFIVVGHGASPLVSGMGAIIRDSEGEVVFNSNSNIVVGVGAESSWEFLGRVGRPGEYEEKWRLKETAPTDADVYFMVIPNKRYRRYNGETAQVYMINYTGRSLRRIIGGRSGSPAHTPIVWVSLMKPIERW